MNALRALIVCCAIVAAAVPARASAGWWEDFWAWFGGTGDKYAQDSNPDRAIGDYRNSVPEFDPAAVGSIAVLLGGGAVMLARRRRAR